MSTPRKSPSVSFLSFADAITGHPEAALLDGAVYETLQIDGHDFSIVAALPPSPSARPKKLSYSLETSHPNGTLALTSDQLARAILRGFPIVEAILDETNYFGPGAIRPDSLNVELTDFLESVSMGSARMSIHFNHGFDDERGQAAGYGLAIRHGKDARYFPIPPSVVAAAVANSDLILGYAFVHAPEAAHLVSDWLRNEPDIYAAYLSDAQRNELIREVPPSASGPAKPKGP